MNNNISCDNLLDTVRNYSGIVVDSSDFKSIGKFNSVDATTNPSLILRTVENNSYTDFIESIKNNFPQLDAENLANEVAISFAKEILKIIPGRVSIEINAKYAFDSQSTEYEARKIVDLCYKRNLDTKRVLIKIPATWQGISAARTLEKKSICCNLTLLFCPIQALACADAGVKLISPFVGRISDWWKKNGKKWSDANQDPGVKFVRSIFLEFKKRKFVTEIMGASFRSVDQIVALAGIDLITISPDLLSSLMKLPPKKNLSEWRKNKSFSSEQFYRVNSIKSVSKPVFDSELSNDEMAHQKLLEGIKSFESDGMKLLKLLA